MARMVTMQVTEHTISKIIGVVRNIRGEAIDRNASGIIPDSDDKFAGSLHGPAPFSPHATFLRRSKIHQRSNHRDMKINPVIQPLQAALYHSILRLASRTT